MILTILALALIVIFIAMLIWFATHRDVNSTESVPDGAQANPPVNGTGLWN